MTVDAYAHCAQEKYLPVESLDAVMSACDVSRAVLCQHLGAFDNTYIAGLVGDRPARFAGIALIDHREATWADELASVAAQQFRGLRITHGAVNENPQLLAAAAAAGLIPLIYAPDGIESLISPIRATAQSYPQTPVVISHLGNPRVEGARLVGGEEILLLADEPNVYVVLSGMGMFCDYPYAPLDGFIHGVVEAFGAERLMWGSNFPVCGEDPEAYCRDIGLVRSDGQWGIGPGAAELITNTTARRVWFDE